MQLTFLAIWLVGLAEAGVRHKRITCGRKAEPNEIPWHVQVATFVRKFESFGGTLYNRNTIITAAHSVDDYYRDRPTVWIEAGSLSRTNGTAQWIEVDKVVLHPNASYSPGVGRRSPGDVAILRLKSDVDITPASKPIPLLAKPASTDSFMHCIVSGWGREHTKINWFKKHINLEDNNVNLNTTGMKDGGKPDILRMTYNYPEFNTSICQSMYESAYPNKNYKVYDDIELCSGFMGCSDSCSGDSGGPLACLRKGSKEYELTGVVSWGGVCGNSAAPGVYASIPHFKPWIEECTAALNRGVSTANCQIL